MNAKRNLGKAEKRRYDLPLNRGVGTGFLVMLIALMTFLAILALASSFTLNAMTQRWTSGLENRLTIEIPAQDETGKLLERPAIKSLTEAIATGLQDIPGVLSIHALTEAEIGKLVEPWLGSDFAKGNFPVPGIVSVEISSGNPGIVKAVEAKVTGIAHHARIDTHEEWLSDLLRFTGAMRLAAITLLAVIGLIMVTAVSGAVRSRLAINRAEVELLHLIGARDAYIIRQFQRHSLRLALRGGIAGAMLAAAMLLLIGALAGRMSVAILPDFHLAPEQLALLALTPFAGALIATLTAGWTVTHVLRTFP